MIQHAAITEDTLTVDLADGRTISVPLAWYPRLQNGSRKERSNWRMIGKGEGIHWPDLDEDLSVEGMLRGRRPTWPGTVEAWHEHLDEIRREREEAADWMTAPQVAEEWELQLCCDPSLS